jgi:hypothetical protein
VRKEVRGAVSDRRGDRLPLYDLVCNPKYAQSVSLPRFWKDFISPLRKEETNGHYPPKR